jgi:hypothetical protein
MALFPPIERVGIETFFGEIQNRNIKESAVYQELKKWCQDAEISGHRLITYTPTVTDSFFMATITYEKP